MTGSTAALLDLLAVDYAAAGARLSPLTSEPDGVRYRVDRVNAAPWVLRHFPVHRSIEHIRGDAEVLRLVRPLLVEQLVETRDGRGASQADGRSVIVTKLETGARATPSPAVLRQVGATLGALHQFTLRSGTIRRAGSLPREDLALARKYLADIADNVPANQRDTYDRLDHDVRATSDCEDLPQTLVHSDCHLANVIQTDRGAILLDWDGAGYGPAIASLGWLLYSAAVQSPEGPTEQFHPGRVDAVLTGYSQHRTLNEAELHRLADAIRFRPLVIATRAFHYSVKTKTPASAFGWWSRYTEAEAVADRAATFLHITAVN